ncbi:hypothetical protein H5410_011694 [Solanum commersonii]|uniref:Pentatricopeptide repeat-containing protein n=1 Tax=Solanum commersonii TaxID=4109 RepID=A0A9J6AQ43_SOLCO|nr:hypothetical protein H5410_011694 [Solanum commersonii]
MQPIEAISSDTSHNLAKLLSKCIRTNDLKLGSLIHSRLIKTALKFNTFLANRLIDMKSYGLFQKNARQCGDEFLIDEFTVVGVVNACACLGVLRLLRELHGFATVIGVRFNLVVCNALIDAYGKCGKPEYSYSVFCQMHETDVFSWTSMLVAYIRASRLEDACSLFDNMPVRNVVAWTALIMGFAQNGEGEKALCIFKEMLEEGIVPSASTYVSVLSACADIPIIEKGKQVHGHIFRYTCLIDLHNVFVVNALIDMYCKCGDMISAMTLFGRLDGKDRVTWNSIIIGFAQNGNGEMSLFMFDKLIEAGTKPNHVTFLGVLSACSHCGLLSEGFHYLHSMEREYGIVPQLDHYGILIDLLGRKNRLWEAAELIKGAPWGTNNIGMWGASGCLQAAGRWDDARSLRRYMDNRGLVKEAAYSWIEIKNIRHKFVSKDQSHSRSEEIKELLTKLIDPMKDVGYVVIVLSHGPVSYHNRSVFYEPLASGLKIPFPASKCFSRKKSGFNNSKASPSNSHSGGHGNHGYGNFGDQTGNHLANNISKDHPDQTQVASTSHEVNNAFVTKGHTFTDGAYKQIMNMLGKDDKDMKQAKLTDPAYLEVVVPEDCPPVVPVVAEIGDEPAEILPNIDNSVDTADSLQQDEEAEIGQQPNIKSTALRNPQLLSKLKVVLERVKQEAQCASLKERAPEQRNRQRLYTSG